METSSGELTRKQDSCLSQLVCHTSEQEGCCELYHGTLEVCTENKVRKYKCTCKKVDSMYTTIETQL